MPATPGHLYILDELGYPAPINDPVAWAKWHESDTRSMLGQDSWHAANGKQLTVTTVFVGVDQSSSGPPALWATSVYMDDDPSQLTRHYTSREQAVAGHGDIVREMRARNGQ